MGVEKHGQAGSLFFRFVKLNVLLSIFGYLSLFIVLWS